MSFAELASPPNASIEPLFAFDALPLHIGYQPSSSNVDVPDVFPFIVGVDRRLNLLVQCCDEAIKSLLERVYRCGSQICASMGDPGLGVVYADDFMFFLQHAVGDIGFAGRRILEIGCGRGHLLRRLHSAGAHCQGVEPGAECNPWAEAAGVTIHTRPFEECRLSDAFDVITHYAVLEHVFDPVEFLRAQLMLLAPDGRLVFSVPDCTEHLRRGDLSMLVHEHVSYFTLDSLARLASFLGARVVESRVAGRGGALYSVWMKDGTSPMQTTPFELSDEIEHFQAAAASSLSRLASRLGDIRRSGRSLGVYCPGRFMNYHYLLQDVMPAVRYFDDNPAAQGKYFPPLPPVCETRKALQEQPTDEILVMSRSFGREIADSLARCVELASSSIQTIDQWV